MPGERTFRGAARRAAADVDPDLVSLASLLAAVAAGTSFYLGHPVPAAFLVVVSGFLDVVDGEVARLYDSASRRGDFLDHSFDRVADAAIFVGVGLGPAVPASLGLAAALSTVLVAYLGTQAEAVGLQRVYGGVARRSNVMGLVVVAALVEPLLPGLLEGAVLLVVVLSVVTFLQRFRAIYRGLE